MSKIISFLTGLLVMAGIVAIGIYTGLVYIETNMTPLTIAPHEPAPVQFMAPPQQPTAVPVFVAEPTATPQPTPTAAYIPTPTAQFAPQFLADCAYALSNGRRSHPNCPTNAAEMLGQGR